MRLSQGAKKSNRIMDSSAPVHLLEGGKFAAEVCSTVMGCPSVAPKISCVCSYVCSFARICEHAVKTLPGAAWGWISDDQALTLVGYLPVSAGGGRSSPLSSL